MKKLLALLTILSAILFSASSQAEGLPTTDLTPETISSEADATEIPNLVLAYDFYYYWAIGRGTLENKNIYDKEVYYQLLLEAGRPKTWSISGLLYPPWATWFAIPFSTVSFPVARVIWVVFSVLVFSLTAYSLRSKNLLPNWAQVPGSLPVYLSFLLLFPPVLRSFHLGQAAYLLLASFALYLYFDKRKSFFKAGLALSISLIKFHLLLPVYAALLVRFLK